MNSSGQKVYIYGRLRELTKRRIGQLAEIAGLCLTSRPRSADIIVLAHSNVSSAVSDEGELHLRFQLKAGASVLSERQFKSLLGISAPVEPSQREYSVDQVAARAGLNVGQLRVLALFDVLNPVEDRFSYADVAAARAAGRLAAAGVGFAKIASAALALLHRGSGLSSVQVREAPWGELVQVFEGKLARLDGQLLLPLKGEDVDAEKAFAYAEACERNQDLESARKWYELATKLDPSDPIIPFNLGNVLDELGRPREAEIAYRRAIGRSPELADAWFNLGVLQESAGREAEALSSYEQAVAAEPGYTDALHNAALLHMRKARFAEALPLFEKIVAMSRTDAAGAKRLAHLCRLELKHAAER